MRPLNFIRLSLDSIYFIAPFPKEKTIFSANL